jgi:hypothetical protein
MSGVDWKRVGQMDGEKFVAQNPDLLEEIDGADPCDVLMESGINRAHDRGFHGPGDAADAYVEGFIEAAAIKLQVQP